MAVYRCAACGSPKVIAEKQAGGYSYKKGIFGTLLLGAGGAVAGINGKEETVYKCPDCGQTLKNCMSEKLKNMIDICMLSTDARENITILGEHIDWSTLKRKYPNMGEGVADIPIAAKKPAVAQNSIYDTAYTCDDDVVEKIAKVLTDKKAKTRIRVDTSGKFSPFYSVFNDYNINIWPQNRKYEEIIEESTYSYQGTFYVALYILKEINHPVSFDELRDLYYKVAKKIGCDPDKDFESYTEEFARYMQSEGYENFANSNYPQNYSDFERGMERALESAIKNVFDSRRFDVNLFREDNPSEFYFTLGNTIKLSNIPYDLQDRLKRAKKENRLFFIMRGELRGVIFSAI